MNHVFQLRIWKIVTSAVECCVIMSMTPKGKIYRTVVKHTPWSSAEADNPREKTHRMLADHIAGTAGLVGRI